jgi:hypothetical protein
MTFFKTLLTDHKIILAYLSFFAGIGFGIAGLALPPIGLIHSSVLILIAQLLVLTATLLGLNIKFDLERKYFHTNQEPPQNKPKNKTE